MTPIDVNIIDSCEGISCITIRDWVPLIGTLFGAIIGAIVGGNISRISAERNMERQQREKENREDFEFVKIYSRLDPYIISIIRRSNYLLEGKISQSTMDANINVIQQTVTKLDEFPPSLITQRKYSHFIKCYSAIKDIFAIFEWYKETATLDRELLESAKEKIEDSHKCLRN